MSAPEPGPGAAGGRAIDTSGLPDHRYYRRWSPRTAELPMAFTFGEFARGALLALGIFNGLAVLALGPGMAAWSALTTPGHHPDPGILPFMLFTPVVTGPWSLAALILVGGPLAYLLGRILRRTPRTSVHLLCFAVLGLAVGGATTIVQALTWRLFLPGTISETPGEILLGALWMILLFAALTAIAVALGWWITASRALRADAHAGVGPLGASPAQSA